MLQKLLAVALGVAVVGHIFFRPQLRQLGKKLDRIVTWLVITIVLTWIGQLLYLWLTLG